MVNSDWRDRARATFERILAPESGSLKSKKAKARATARKAAAAVATVKENGAAGVTDPKMKDA